MPTLICNRIEFGKLKNRTRSEALEKAGFVADIPVCTDLTARDMLLTHADISAMRIYAHGWGRPSDAENENMITPAVVVENDDEGVVVVLTAAYCQAHWITLPFYRRG